MANPRISEVDVKKNTASRRVTEPPTSGIKDRRRDAEDVRAGVCQVGHEIYVIVAAIGLPSSGIEKELALSILSLLEPMAARLWNLADDLETLGVPQ